MRIDGLIIREGAVIHNLVLPSGDVLPTFGAGSGDVASEGEIFRLADGGTLNTVNVALGGTWREVSVKKTDGTIEATGFNATSARKHKENIEPYTDNAEKLIRDIDVVSFTYKKDASHTPRVGFIADDTDSVFSGPAKDTMDLPNTVGVIIKAVQNIIDRLDKLEASL